MGEEQEEKNENHYPCLAFAMAKKDVNVDFFGQKLHVEKRTIYENNHWIFLAAFCLKTKTSKTFLPFLFFLKEILSHDPKAFLLLKILFLGAL